MANECGFACLSCVCVLDGVLACCMAACVHVVCVFVSVSTGYWVFCAAAPVITQPDVLRARAPKWAERLSGFVVV